MASPNGRGSIAPSQAIFAARVSAAEKWTPTPEKMDPLRMGRASGGLGGRQDPTAPS